MLLVVLLVVGLCSPWRARRESAQLGQMAAPIALLVGSVLFLAFAAAGPRVVRLRPTPASRATCRSTTAMVLPALAVALDAVARRWRPLVPVAVVLLVIGAPFSLRGVSHTQEPLEEALREHEAHDPEPAPFAHRDEGARGSPAGAVHGARSDDRLAPRRCGRGPNPATAVHHPQAQGVGAVPPVLLPDTTATAPTTECVTISKAVAMRVRMGQVIGVYDNPIVIVPLSAPPLVGFGLAFVPDEGNAVTVVRPVTRKIEIRPFNGLFLPRSASAPA